MSITGLLGLFSQQGKHVVLAAFDTTWVDGIVVPGTEISEAAFFSPEDLPPLAFARDVKILVAWQRFRNNQDKSERLWMFSNHFPPLTLTPDISSNPLM